MGFHRPPSFFQPGEGLELGAYHGTPTLVDNRIVAPAAAREVPEVPKLTETSIGVAGSSEPLVAYNSDQGVEWNIESTDNKEASLTFKNRETAWRLIARPDGDLYVSYLTQSKEEVIVLKMDTVGSIHFY